MNNSLKSWKFLSSHQNREIIDRLCNNVDYNTRCNRLTSNLRRSTSEIFFFEKLEHLADEQEKQSIVRADYETEMKYVFSSTASVMC